MQHPFPGYIGSYSIFPLTPQRFQLAVFPQVGRKALPMAYAKTSLRKEKRDLRERMRGLGLGYRDIAAEFTKSPVRLGWAVTIRKSQGKTYDRAVIDLGSGAFAPGQTYVALSRLTSLDGLYLSRPLRPRDIQVDPDVRRFMSAAHRPPEAPAS